MPIGRASMAHLDVRGSMPSELIEKTARYGWVQFNATIGSSDVPPGVYPKGRALNAHMGRTFRRRQEPITVKRSVVPCGRRRVSYVSARRGQAPSLHLSDKCSGPWHVSHRTITAARDHEAARRSCTGRISQSSFRNPTAGEDLVFSCRVI